MVGVLTAWMIATLAARPGTVIPVPAPGQAGQIAIDPGKLPLTFVPNQGQVAPEVHFEAGAYGGRLFFAPGEVALALPTADEGVYAPLRLRFEGAATAEIEGLSRQPGTMSYFQGSDPAQWQAGLPTYGDIVYRAIYPGIDLHYTGNEGLLKGNYYVAPGANPGLISWRYEGAESLRIDPASGNLLIGIAGSQVVEQAPIAWQEQNGVRIPVAAHYILAPGGLISFSLGSYNPTLPLTIDPVLSYRTFLGGTAVDRAYDVAIDSTGAVYIVGQSFSASLTGFTTIGTRNNADAFVAKFNADLTALTYGAYLGGSLDDAAYGVAVDGTGRAYITGSTFSANFPTAATPWQAANAGGEDAFVARLNAAGSALEFGTYFGGNLAERANAIAIDTATGNAYITGSIQSAAGTFATNPFGSGVQTDRAGGSDVFVARLGNTGSVTYATYLGDIGNEEGQDIAFSTNLVYITGATGSTNFPITANALDNTIGATGRDAFVTYLNPGAAGAAGLLYSTFLGGNSDDYGNSIAVDTTTTSIFIAGQTTSTDLITTYPAPVSTPYQSTLAGGTDAFVVQLTGPATIGYNTYLGGPGNDSANALAIGTGGAMFVTGKTTGSGFPVQGNLQNASGGGEDAFLTQFNTTGGTSLVYSTYLGGTGNETGYGIAVSISGTTNDAYVVGESTSATGFPGQAAATPYQADNGGSTDAFVLRLSIVLPNLQPDTLTFNEDEPLPANRTVNVLANDTAPPVAMDPASVAIAVAPPVAAGTATVNADGTITFTPAAANINSTTLGGNPTFTYRACDTQGVCSTAQVTVVITPVNDPPVVTVPAAVAIPAINEEGTTAAITGFDVADVEAQAGNLPVQITLSVPLGSGILNVNTGGGAATITGDGTRAVTVTGALATVKTALDTTTFTGATDANGSIVLTAVLSDLGNAPAPALTDTKTTTIVVNPVNDPPNAVNDTATTPEDTAVTIDVVANDNDNRDTQAPANPTGYTPAFTIANVTQPAAGGTVAINNNQIVFTPAQDFVGNATFTYNITDNGDPAPGQTSATPGTVTVTVTAVNDAPTITPGGPYNGVEEGPAIALNGISVADVDVATGAMTVTVTAFTPGAPLGNLSATGAGGATVTGSGTVTVTIVGNLTDINTTLGSLQFTPLPNASGSLNLTVTANDQGNTGAGGPLTGTAQIPLVIDPINDTPVANNDTAQVNEDDPNGVTINVLANDNDNADILPPANPGTYTFNPTVNLVTPPPAASGTLTQNGGNFTFVPAPNFNGTVTFVYNITDTGNPLPGLTSANATVTITIAAVNDAPEFTKGADQTVNEDAGAQTAPGWATAISPGPAGATDELNQTLTFSVTNNTNPTLFQVQPTVASNGTLTYTPAANAFGTATITLILIDDGGVAGGGSDRSAPQTFTITINPINDPPVVLGQTTITVPEDAGIQNIFGWASPGVPANESGQNIRLRIGSNTNPGLFVLSPTLALTNTLRFLTAPNAFGSAVLEVGVLDDGGTANGGVDVITTTLTINVTAVNDPPVAVNDPATAGDPAFTTAEDTSLTIPGATLTANDTDVDNTILTVSAVGTPSANGGSVSVSSNSVTYTPALNFFGTDTFSYTVSDGAGGTDFANVTVTVTPVNDAPVAGDDRFFVIIDSTNSPLNVLANDTDVENNPLIISAVTTPASGTLVISSDGKQLLYTPARGFRGTVTFNYTISDGNGGTATASVTLTIDVARLYLPIVRTPPQPELVGSFTLNPANPQARQLTTISAVVTNTGTLTTTPFWVDLYINPRTPPKINEPWNELCSDFDNCLGIAWYVDRPLPPGGSITLVSVPRGSEANNGFVSTPTRTYLGYEGEGYSVWTNGFRNAGSYELYLYVDVWNRDTSGTARDPNGAIREIDENNNLTRRTVTVSPAASTSEAEIQTQPLPRFTPAPRYLRREAQEQ